MKLVSQIRSMPSIAGARTTSFISKKLKRGSGSTWPGHIALKIDRNIIQDILALNPDLKTILVVGTNGKTTTSKLLEHILSQKGLRVFRNAEGANLVNGIASSLLSHSTIAGKIEKDVAIFEVDENTLPHTLKRMKPDAIIFLNLFRDQLDRYGEVNTIAEKWHAALKYLPPTTHLFVNGDDPILTFIAKQSGAITHFFGMPEEEMKKNTDESDMDFLYCPKCSTKLVFKKKTYSHMGLFVCPHCDFAHASTTTFPTLPNPLFGNYNKYNTSAAAITSSVLFGLQQEVLSKSLANFTPAFGRQEEIFYNGKKIVMLLSKNPAGFNQSIEAVLSVDEEPNILLLLNDRIPDGRDISWIWDVNFEKLKKARTITISGDRSYDMGLRIQYTEKNARFEVISDLHASIRKSVEKTGKKETLFILPTYSAMLEARKILTGKKIL